MQFFVLIAGLVLAVCASGATLEKLSVEQMTKHATMIVRGRITACNGESRGAVIYTRCSVAVSETWKGALRPQVDFVVPGGRVRSVSQTFTGTPKFNPNDQFVLFLWVGRSGLPQIIGLSQGVFDVTTSPLGQTSARRSATKEIMLDAKGNPARDEDVTLPLSDLRRQVNVALAVEAN